VQQDCTAEASNRSGFARKRTGPRRHGVRGNDVRGDVDVFV